MIRSLRSSPQGMALSEPAFLRLWLGQVASSLGDQIAYMGLSFLILYRLGGTVLDLGKLSIAAAVPTLFIGPIAGVLVDRWSRRYTMVAADIVRGLIYLAMPFVTSLPVIYASVFVANVMSRFFYPAKSAILPNIVGTDRLMAANGLVQATGGVIAVLGPALGAALASLLGTEVVFYANAVSFFISAILILGIRADRVSTETKPPETESGVAKAVIAVGRQLGVGLRFIAQTADVRFYVWVFAAFGLLIGGLNVVIMPLLKEVMGFDMATIGLVQSAMALGGLVGAIWISTRAVVHPRRTVVAAVAGMGALIMAVGGLVRAHLSVFVVAALIGASMAMFQVPTNSELMRLVPDRVRGRVFGSFGALTDGLQLVSMAAGPIAAVRFGLIRTIVGIGAGLTTLGLGGLAAAGQKRPNKVTDCSE